MPRIKNQKETDIVIKSFDINNITILQKESKKHQIKIVFIEPSAYFNAKTTEQLKNMKDFDAYCKANNIAIQMIR